MRYHAMGELPAKRHTQFRENGTLLTEEVMGYEGFSGNESILYHLQSPCRVAEVGEFTPIVLEEWVIGHLAEWQARLVFVRRVHPVSARDSLLSSSFLCDLCVLCG